MLGVDDSARPVNKMISDGRADNPQIDWTKKAGQNYVEPEFLISSGVMGRPSETVRDT